MAWISRQEPVIQVALPQIRDYVLTGVMVVAFATFPFLSALPESLELLALAAVVVYLVGVPWWLWRSVKGWLYYKQNREHLSTKDKVHIVATNMFTFGSVLWIIMSLGLY